MELQSLYLPLPHLSSRETIALLPIFSILVSTSPTGIHSTHAVRVARNMKLSGDEKGDEQTCIPTFFAAHVLRLIFYCTDR